MKKKGRKGEEGKEKRREMNESKTPPKLIFGTALVAVTSYPCGNR